MKDQFTITWTGRVVKESIPRHFELFEYTGTNEQGELIKVYVYRIEKVDENPLSFKLEI